MTKTTTKERSLRLTAREVLAVLDGRLTQLRVMVKPQPNSIEGDATESEFLLNFPASLRRYDGERCSLICNVNMPLFCPLGRAGERLWVKEQWSEWDDGSGAPVFMYRADKSAQLVLDWKGQRSLIGEAEYNPLEDGESIRWRPSTQMPRWASRITLELTAIRVEQLSAMTDADALACGVANDRQREGTQYAGKWLGWFKEDWIAKHGSWQPECWVWVADVSRV